MVGLAVAALVIGHEAGTGHSSSDVLFSGETALGPLLPGSAGYSIGALLMLLVCKSLAYSLSLSGFRGGPVFPSMFLGAAGGVVLSHLPGLPLVAGVAMGIGAMCVVMLKLPLTSVLLATLLLFSDGLAVMPLVIGGAQWPRWLTGAGGRAGRAAAWSSRSGDARPRSAWGRFRSRCGRAARRAQDTWSVR